MLLLLCCVGHSIHHLSTNDDENKDKQIRCIQAKNARVRNMVAFSVTTWAKQRLDPQQNHKELDTSANKAKANGKGTKVPSSRYSPNLNCKMKRPGDQVIPTVGHSDAMCKQITTLSTQGTHNMHVARCWCCFVIHSYGDSHHQTHQTHHLSGESTIRSEESGLALFY